MNANKLWAGLVLLGLAAVPAHSQIVSGEMTCSVAGGFGLVVGSSRGISCAYDRPDGATDFYMGTSSHIGFDLGPADALTVTYRVVGANPAVRGSLAGAFAGVGAGATIGSGIGADALVGGNGGMVYLIPTGNEARTGLNLTAGVLAFRLRYVGSEPRPRHVDPIYR